MRFFARRPNIPDVPAKLLALADEVIE